MKMNGIIAAVVVVLAAGGYNQFSYVPAQKAAQEAAAAEKAAAEVRAAVTADAADPILVQATVDQVKAALGI